jgi:hypothetical protein
MYAEIYGSGDSMWCKVFMMAVVIMLIVVIGLLSAIVNKSDFANLPDYGIGQRRDVIAATPAFTELSLQQKIDNATAGVKTSQLTGSRDIPVFFQDYDIEAVRSKSGSAVSTAREGFEGAKADDELSKAMSGF